jgi:hypothetical protein
MRRIIDGIIEFFLYYIIMLCFSWVSIKIIYFIGGLFSIKCTLTYKQLLESNYVTFYFTLMFLITLQLYIKSLKKGKY